ncbi:aldehyde dehydrogenase family protein [Vibrio sp. PP-XX7]
MRTCLFSPPFLPGLRPPCGWPGRNLRPLAPLIRFQTEADALTIANDTPYGLGAYYYTQNIQRAWRFGEALEADVVGLNTGVISMDAAPLAASSSQDSAEKDRSGRTG